MNSRVEAIKALLSRAADRYGEPRIKDVPINITDRGNNDPNSKVYSMCYDTRQPEFKKYCGPDWTFVYWPECNIESYEKTRDEIIEAGLAEPTIDKAMWYGNMNSPLKDVPESITRPNMVAIGEKNKEIMNVRHVFPPLPFADPKYRSMPELIRGHRALIDIGGNGYSGRIKWLLFSRRPIIMVERFFVEYFHHDLKPWEHYVPVRMDLADLVEKTKWVLENRNEGNKIADNAFKFAMNNFSEKKLLERIWKVCQALNII